MMDPLNHPQSRDQNTRGLIILRILPVLMAACEPAHRFCGEETRLVLVHAIIDNAVINAQYRRKRLPFRVQYSLVLVIREKL